MTNGLKNIKLSLLGIAAAVIPILFILQADNINSQKEDLGKQKIKTDSLAAINFKQAELIVFFKTELSKKNLSDSGRSLIYFNPIISSPKQENVGVSSSIDDLRRSVENIGNILSNGKGSTGDKQKNPNFFPQEQLLNYRNISDSLSKLNEIIDNLKSDRKYLDEQLIYICTLNGNRDKQNTQIIFNRLDSICNNFLQKGYQYYRNYPK